MRDTEIKILWFVNKLAGKPFIHNLKKSEIFDLKVISRCGLVWSFGSVAFNLDKQFAKQPILVRYSSKPFYSSIICIYKQFLCLKKCSPEIILYTITISRFTTLTKFTWGFPTFNLLM